MATAAGSKKDTVLYEWEGKDAKGNKQRGMITSPSPELVKAKLRRQGIIPLKIKKKKSGGRKQKIEPGDICLLYTSDAADE